MPEGREATTCAVCQHPITRHRPGRDCITGCVLCRADGGREPSVHRIIVSEAAYRAALRQMALRGDMRLTANQRRALSATARETST